MESERNRLVRRNGSYHSRVCNHNLGSSWIRWDLAGYFAQRRSQRDAFRSNSFGSHRRSELGSVTAEFAVVLPAVILILFFGIQALAIQSARMNLIGLAAESARALARGEDISIVDGLLAERASDLKSEVQYLELSICVAVSQNSKIIGLLDFFTTERQCARKSGL
jgi:hypothetical protein